MSRLMERVATFGRRYLEPLSRRWPREALRRLFRLPLLAHVTAAASVGLLSYLVWSALRESAEERDRAYAGEGNGKAPAAE